MKSRKILTVTLGIVVALVFGIVIAYAALSSTLNTKFNGVTQSALSWNVSFYTGNPSNSIMYVSPSVAGTSSTGRSCGTAAVTANSIVVSDTTISKPGDSCSYDFSIENKGSIDAKVSSITALKPNSSCTVSGTSMTCGYIKYQLSNVTTSTTLSKNSLKYANMTVTYIGTGVQSSSGSQSGGGFQIVFGQA